MERLLLSTKCECCNIDERVALEYYCVRCADGEHEWHGEYDEDEDKYYHDEDEDED